MNILDFRDEVEPGHEDQEDYEVMVQFSDETGKGVFAVDQVRWDHNQRRVIIEASGVE